MTAVRDRNSIDRILHEQADALEGFSVIAIDGEAGRVAKDQSRTDPDHLLIHLDGFLGIFGNHDVVIETEAIDVVDTQTQMIHVDRIIDWVKSSPKVKQFLEDHDTTDHDPGSQEDLRQDRDQAISPPVR